MADGTIMRLADRVWQDDRPAILAVDDFLRLELPPREFLLDPIVPTKGLAMLYGPRGLGKTHVALGIA